MNDRLRADNEALGGTEAKVAANAAFTAELNGLLAEEASAAAIGFCTVAYQYTAQGKASVVYGTRCCACYSAAHDMLEHVTGSCEAYAAECARNL